MHRTKSNIPEIHVGKAWVSRLFYSWNNKVGISVHKFVKHYKVAEIPCIFPGFVIQ